MERNPLYPRIVEEYKSHLCSRSDGHVSFSAFCRRYNVLAKSVAQWMRRHGLDVATLRCEAMLSGDGLAPSGPSSFDSGEKRAPGTGEKRKSGQGLGLAGISLTFPDGLVVGIRRGDAVELTKFIESYNKIIDKNHVQPQ